MYEATKFSAAGEKMGTVPLPEHVFNVESKHPEAVIYEVIKMYLANQRQGTSAVKTRSEVRGSTRKFFRQKGTGNARVGSRRTVVRVGGGRAFGPQPKNWYRQIPRKKKRLALKLALTQLARDGGISVIEDLNFAEPNTRTASDILTKVVSDPYKVLLLIDGSDQKIIKSFSNLPQVRMDRADGIYAYEILNSRHIILTESALKKIEEVFA